MQTSLQQTIRTIVAAAFALSIMSGCSGSTSDPKDKTDQPVAVKTVTVAETELARRTTQPATVHPYYEAAIHAKVFGYVKTVDAEFGDVVNAGAMLATIDVPELKKQRLTQMARLQQRLALLARTSAEVKLAESKVTAAKAAALEAESKIGQVKAALVAAEAEFQRTKELVGGGSIDERMLDEARKKRDSETASEKAASAAAASARADVDVAESQLLAALADSKAAEADKEIQQRQLEEIDERLKFATITAPFPGVVSARNVSPGDLVREESSDKPLFVVSQVDKVRIQVSLPEDEAVFVTNGDTMRVTFPSFPDQEFITATVTRTTGRLNAGTRTMLVEAEVGNPDGKLLPGLFGQASIELSNKVATVLPARAVRFREDGSAYVYVLEDDTVSVVAITTGQDDGHQIEITTGLKPGQTVIDAHLQRFTTGQSVRVVN